MPFPPAEKVSQNEFAEILSRLDFLLANLPTQLPSGDGPESQYRDFLSFGLDSDILEKTGDEVATLGEQLEYIFGWNVLRAVQSGDSTAANESEADGGLESDDDNEVMDTDEDQPAQPIVFEIDPDIDINSLALKDMVSTDPIARESAQPSACPRAADTSNKEPDWNW
jgi:hypothetical protein